MSTRLFRLVLRSLPRAFFNEYGDEMIADFDRRHRARGPVARIALWLEALPDIALTAVREHGAILRQDLRHAVRAFRNAPGYPLVAIAIVALGVGANTAIFTVVDHALVRPLPYDDPERLVQLWESAPSHGYPEVEPAPATFYDWQAQNSVFDGMAAYADAVRNLTGTGMPERVRGTMTTSSLFTVLGASTARGRPLIAADDAQDGPAVIVLSHGFWQRRFGGDANIVGRAVQFDGETHEVVGVMPPTFHFPRPSVDFWIPLRLSPDDRNDRQNHFTLVVARLGQDVTIDAAKAEMNVIAAAIGKAFPETNADSTVLVRSLRDEMSRQSRTALVLLSFAAAGVLLIGCANLANLLFARAAARRKELGVRVALGAGVDRLVRQILTENLLLSTAGGVLGVLAAYGLLPVLAHLVPDNLPIAAALRLDARVLAFGVALSALTGIAFALLPAWQLSREATARAVREGGRDGVGGQRAGMRSGLVVAEVAVSVVLLIGAGLLIRALGRVSAVDTGFRSDGVVTLRTALPEPRYPEPADRERFYDEVLTRVRALPGVRRAGYTGFLPLVMRGIVWPVGIDGVDPGDGPQPIAVFREVTEGYLETLDVRVTQGRHFGAEDTYDSVKTAIVSQSFADKFWPDRAAVGETFRFLVPWMEDAWTVGGVVPDIRARGLERRNFPQVYVLHRQMTVASFHAPRDLAVRFDGDTRALIPELRRIVWEVDPEQPIADVQTMAQIVTGETADRRHQLRLLGVFAGLAFLMAGLGIYGVLAFLVSQRTQEIGVRMALGARPIDVMRMIVGKGLALTGLGLAVGIAGGLVVGNAIRHLLFDVQPFDLPVLIASAGLCVVAAIAACGLPAWRATKVDPLTALRAE